MEIIRCKSCHGFYDSVCSPFCPHCGCGDLPPELCKYGALQLIQQKKDRFVFSLGEAYILKVLIGSTADSKAGLGQEYRIFQSLQDGPHIAQLVECVRTENALYLVEPRYTPLSEYIRSRSIYWNDILRITDELSKALAFCHNRGIYHLDVHPRNIFIDKKGGVRLADFGNALEAQLCQSCTGHSQLSEITPRYVFPAYYVKYSAITEQWDVFSLCLVLYGLLNKGLLPWMELSPEEAARKYLMKEVIPSPGTDPLSRLAIAGLEGQYLTVDAFRRELEQLCYPKVYASPFGRKNSSFFKRLLAKKTSAATSEEKPSAPYAYPPLEPQIQTVPSPFSDTTSAPPSGTVPCFDSMVPVYPSPNPCCPQYGAAYSMPYASQAEFCGHDVGSAACLPAEPFDADDVAATVPVSFNAFPPQASAATPRISDVFFSAVCEKSTQRDSCIAIDVLMYEQEFRAEVDCILADLENGQEKRSGLLKARQGTHVMVELRSGDIALEDNQCEMIWEGQYLDFSFFADIPANYSRKQIRFTAAVSFDGIPATRLKFMVNCADSEKQEPSLLRSDITSAFISYASQDRRRVASLVQGMHSVRPDLDLFFDIDSLQAGQLWEKALYEEIDRRDYLFLCWSRSAALSDWVSTEWHYALQSKGDSRILPIPLEPPELCPPPLELNNKHFNYRLLYLIQSGK